MISKLKTRIWLPSTIKTTITKYNLSYFVILIAWAWIQYIAGYKLYSIFILIYFIFLIITRARFFTFIIASVFILLFFSSPSMDMLTRLKSSNEEFFKNPSQSLNQILAPNSGKEFLPAPVPQMLSLLYENQIENYQLSAQYEKNQQTQQRITEAAWPIKLEKTSQNFLISSEDLINYSHCNKIDQKEDVILVYCH